MQDLGSELIHSNDNTALDLSQVTHSTLSNTPCVSNNQSCTRNGSGHKSNDHLLLPVPSQQALNYGDIHPFESEQGKIPPHILQNKAACVDYVNCSQQNGIQFGFIPLTLLKIYTGEHTCNNVINYIVDLHKTVKPSNLPNFMGCRIPLQSRLNIANWRKYMLNHWDQQLVDLLAFGFPLDFDHSRPLEAIEVNHASATAYSDHIDKYLQDEIQFGAIYGPFHL